MLLAAGCKFANNQLAVGVFYTSAYHILVNVTSFQKKLSLRESTGPRGKSIQEKNLKAKIS